MKRRNLQIQKVREETEREREMRNEMMISRSRPKMNNSMLSKTKDEQKIVSKELIQKSFDDNN